MSGADVPICWSSGKFCHEWINANVQIFVNCLLNTDGLLSGDLEVLEEPKPGLVGLSTSWS